MKKPDETIIQKFIENRCSETEYKLMMEYLNSLNETEQNLFMDSHINQIETRPVENINGYEGNFNSIISKITPEKEHGNSFSRRTIYSVAASIAFFIFLSTAALYYLGVFSGKPEIIWNENITEMGQKFTLSLSDGSAITLNGGGKLRYPQKFRQDSRDIYLEGEAYFEVTHDSSRPFIVHSGNLSTTVLGTKFNISAFPGENEISVSLVEGNVKVTSGEANGIKGSVLLEPKQKLTYSVKEDLSKIKDFDYQKEIGWKDNILKFEKEPLQKIFVVLERTYGVKFELSDRSYLSLRITANFNKASLWTVAEVIKKLTDLKYRTVKENNTVKKFIFYKK